ncbi:MAG: haloacid dehalogenase type II [Haloarculaceae archaeon]
MAFDPEPVETVTVDSFTTLVDVHGPTRKALAEHVEDPDAVASIWRSRAVDYRMVATFLDRYEPYRATTRDALEYALAVHGYDLPDGAVDEVVGTFEELPVFDDVRGSIERLVDTGYDVAVLSNGEPDLLASIVERAGVEDLLSAVVSAEEIRAYKPASAIYEHGAERAGTPIERIAHATTPWYDVYGAMGAGMRGIWVNRRDRPWDAFDGEPSLVVDSLAGLADAFEA